MANGCSYQIEFKVKIFLRAGQEGHRNKYALGKSRGRRAIKPVLADFCQRLTVQ
ncbi:hypothetical protein HMPREF9540_03075 [Escherichia coli MS 115-1]|nr:hypothetical protein HMPREF9540_03075 [Escherichia coli MS 115-1]